VIEIEIKKLSQDNAPIFEALNKYKNERIVKFDVPGHKGGRGNKELTNFLGEACMQVDVNSMKMLDFLGHPESVIKDAEIIAAEAFSADSAFLMVGGTTSSVQAMIMYACKAGDKIIMPRNVHKSAINALVICGAVPVYVNPGMNKDIGIALGMAVEDVRDAIMKNPDAKAVFINNPTYYGICSDLRSITKLAHEHNMLVLVDEAWGTHFYFGENQPVSAMEAGADAATVSMHKTGGALTQSSFLICGKKINQGYMRQIINLMQTTSGSYLLLTSLDLARKNMFLNGRDLVNKTVDFAEYARREINKIGGYYAYSKELINGGNIYDFDLTRLSVYTREIGLAGKEVYDILRDEYDIQIELGDIGNIIAIISAGDREFEIERLIAALTEIKRLYAKDKTGMLESEYINPVVKIAPQEAFYCDKTSVLISESMGKISGEFVMCYPPGIPILAPGEEITRDIVDYILYAKEKGCFLMGTEDMDVNYINVVI
jgi:lysine decarboxylase